MNVAKTYKEWEKVGEIYILNNKQYIKAKHPNTGNLRQIRVYSDAEYKRMYPNEKNVEKKDSNTPRFKNQKNILGFSKGYITIFKGAVAENDDWFHYSNARYARPWGWYISSAEKVPTDIPEGIYPIKLKWSDVSIDDSALKSEDEIRKIVDAIIFKPSKSSYIGEIGDRITTTVKIKQVLDFDGNYGTSHMHIMEDENENVFIWTTATKRWEKDTTHTINGTVKDHRNYQNQKQTILTRCKEMVK